MRSQSSLQCCSQTPSLLCRHQLRRLPWRLPPLHPLLHLLKPLPVRLHRLLQVSSLHGDLLQSTAPKGCR